VKYSVSKINEYLSCPYKFKKLYVDKIPQAKSKYLSFGLAFEDILEHIYNNADLYVNNFNDDVINKLIEDFWICNQYKKEYNNQEETFKFLGFSSKKEEEKYKRDTFFYLKEYFRVNKIEKQFAFELPIEVSYNNRIFKGRIDHIKKTETDLIIIDNKVSDKIIYNMDTSIQLGLYLYAMRVLYPKTKITHIGYYYIKLNKLSVVPVDKVKIKDILHTINGVCDKIELELYNKQENSYCYFCQFKNECK